MSSRREGAEGEKGSERTGSELDWRSAAFLLAEEESQLRRVPRGSFWFFRGDWDGGSSVQPKEAVSSGVDGVES